MAIAKNEAQNWDNTTNVGCEVTERRDKHLEINAAINSIDQVFYQSERLLERITDNPCVKNPVEDSPLPTLTQLLQNAPEEIRSKCDSIHRVLDEIEKHLF